MLLSEEGAGEKSKAGLLGLSRLTRPHTLPPDAGREDMVDFLVVEGSKLLYQGVISIPIILWTGASEEERDAIDRIGFLFSNYTVEHYQYELVEVIRKFIMTGFIIFLWPSSTEQIAIGVLVTTTAMVYVMRAMPYANHHIGSLQAAMLAAQSATLFFGLLLAVDTIRRSQLTGDEVGAYQDVGSTILLIGLSTVIFLVPPLTLVWEHRRSIAEFCAPRFAARRLRHRHRRSARHSEQGAPKHESSMTLDPARIRRCIESASSEELPDPMRGSSSLRAQPREHQADEEARAAGVQRREGERESLPPKPVRKVAPAVRGEFVFAAHEQAEQADGKSEGKGNNGNDQGDLSLQDILGTYEPFSCNDAMAESTSSSGAGGSGPRNPNAPLHLPLIAGLSTGSSTRGTGDATERENGRGC